MKRIVYKDGVVTVEKEEFSANGRKFSIDRIKGPDAVVIIPFLNRETILIEKIYRPVIKKHIFELPAGKVDKAEKWRHAARRELKEETGYSAKKLEFLFSAYASPGMNTQRYIFYKATGLIKGSRHLSKSEIIEVKSIRLRNALKLIKTNKIIDVKTIAAILFISAI